MTIGSIRIDLSTPFQELHIIFKLLFSSREGSKIFRTDQWKTRSPCGWIYRELYWKFVIAIAQHSDIYASTFLVLLFFLFLNLFPGFSWIYQIFLWLEMMFLVSKKRKEKKGCLNICYKFITVCHSWHY